CGFPAVAVGAPTASVDVLPWRDDLLPPIFTAADTLARRSFPPDSLTAAERDHAAARFASHAPALDGDLGEWRLVRWDGCAGARSRLAGDWNGDEDASVHFALQWDANGIWFAARLRDDHLSTPTTPVLDREAVLVSFASASPLVERYWSGGSRTIRVRIDGH